MFRIITTTLIVCSVSASAALACGGYAYYRTPAQRAVEVVRAHYYWIGRDNDKVFTNLWSQQHEVTMDFRQPSLATLRKQWKTPRVIHVVDVSVGKKFTTVNAVVTRGKQQRNETFLVKKEGASWRIAALNSFGGYVVDEKVLAQQQRAMDRRLSRASVATKN